MDVPVTALPRGDDHWVLPVSGREVEQLVLDYAVTLRFAGDLVARIEGALIVTTTDGEERLVIPDGDRARLAPVVILVRARARAGRAYDDGHLEMDFEDGATLAVPAAVDYEPWEIAGPSGLRIVSLPGDGLAFWWPARGA